ncbi:MAG TPA: TolC family protein [Phycisphaerae bacterium]|nr:TolC family protein [Phycisphaerae bacterium]
MKTVLRLIALLGASAGWLAGCQPADYRREADKAAYGIIERAQQQSLGRTEPFVLERPADALRRKLLLSHNLPHAGPASLGADALQPIAHWPEKDYLVGAAAAPPQAPWQDQRPLVLSLTDALQVAARSNRDYQTRKEDVFRTALDLDLEANAFRNILAADWESDYSADHSGDGAVRGLAHTGTTSWQRKLKNGALLTAGFAVDLAQLLTQGRSSSLGLFADATITIPLLAGSGRHIVTEALTQAERDVLYSLNTFVRFKRTLAVLVASEYLSVLQQLDQVQNAEDNYRRLIAGTRRARRLADAGRLPQIQVDQALQDELRARDRWITAQQSYARRLDSFKITLGLPTDANIDLDRGELTRLAQAAGVRGTAPAGTRPEADSGPATQPDGVASGPATAPAADAPIDLTAPTREGGGRLEMAAEKAVTIALEHRLDLRTALGQVDDAQRQVVVTADALRAGLTLTGTAEAGERRGISSAGQRDAQLRPEKGVYTAGLLLDLPLERTAERNAYRNSFITLERATRDVQALEDQIKLQVRDALRKLLQGRESYLIQAQSVTVARRRVESTGLFLEAGRAQIRDVLEAQEALVSAQNALTAALVNYRVAELELQRDMGALEVDEKGNWHEYEPDNPDAE